MKSNSREIFEVSDLIKLNALYITTRETRFCARRLSKLFGSQSQIKWKSDDDEWLLKLRGLFW